MYLELYHRDVGILGSYLLSALFTEGHRKPVRRNEADAHAKRRREKIEKYMLFKMPKGF